MGVHNIHSKKDFEQALSENRAVAVDFYADWCAPCKAIAPTFANCSQLDKFKDVRFLKVDIDELSELAKELSIRSIPTFKLYLSNEPVDETQGADRAALLRMLEKAV